MYRKVGNINEFADIPFDRKIIISGGINRSTAWFARVPGIFKKDNDDFRFVDDFGMATRFSKDDSISLSILEKEGANHD